MIKHVLTGLLLSGLVVGSAMAQTTTPAPTAAAPNDGNIDQRLQDQQQRTDQGISSGQMTQHEATRVQDKDASVDAKAAADEQKNGGSLTTAQQQHLDKRLNHNSRAIRTKKHNSRTKSGTGTGTGTPTPAPVNQ